VAAYRVCAASCFLTLHSLHRGWTPKGTLQWLHIVFVRASYFLTLHSLHRGWTHKGTLQWLHIVFVRPHASLLCIACTVGGHTKAPYSGSCFLTLHSLHRLLVVLTGKYFPTSRSRMSSDTPLTPGLLLVSKSDLHLLFTSRPTVNCLTRTSRNESWSR